MQLKLLAIIAIALACGQSVHSQPIDDHDTSTASVGADRLAQQDDIPRRGALYRISRDGATGYLFGTIHVGKQGFFPLEPQVTEALAQASSLVIELDIRDNAPFQLALDKYGIYREGDSLLHHISTDTLQRLMPALAGAGLSLQSVERYKPWLLANVLVGGELERHGFQRSQAVEYFLLSAAKKQDKAVRELESADYQLALFNTMDDAQQETYLRENLADLADGAALKKSEDLIGAWSTADAPRIRAVLRELTTGDSVSASFMQHMLLGKRNPEMASSIEHIMHSGQVPFVGIGLLHLIGDNGVPQLLRQRGYDVERIY